MITDWPSPETMLQQTPKRSGIWEDMMFTYDAVDECDYVIVLNSASDATTVTCPLEHIWSIIQEPPTEFRRSWHANASYSFRTFTTDISRIGVEYIQSQPALGWHVRRDYDFLTALSVPEKTHQLSWITSKLCTLKGHRKRMKFLNRIQGKLAFDLWGRGFTPIEDKWDGLAPYRYSIAVENYSNPLYWSEKLADCYLAWCMPIYYGCTRITDYFPAESLIQIDINQPETAVEQIKEAMDNNAWARNLDAIAHARELILNRYQLFPFLVNQIRHFESTHGDLSTKETVTIKPRIYKTPIWSRMEQKSKQVLVQLARLGDIKGASVKYSL